jgi:uncharacterized membrane protein YkgB
MSERPPTNYRRQRLSQERAFLILVIAVLLVVGTGLIGLIWGATAALMGGLCLFGGSAIIVGLWFLLSLLEKWVGE